MSENFDLFRPNPRLLTLCQKFTGASIPSERGTKIFYRLPSLVRAFLTVPLAGRVHNGAALIEEVSMKTVDQALLERRKQIEELPAKTSDFVAEETRGVLTMIGEGQPGDVVQIVSAMGVVPNVLTYYFSRIPVLKEDRAEVAKILANQFRECASLGAEPNEDTYLKLEPDGVVTMHTKIPEEASNEIPWIQATVRRHSRIGAEP